MDEKFLAKVFAEYANLKNIKVIRDKVTGMHQGYGFIEFESSEVAGYILQTLNGNLIPNSNKVFKLNWATFSAGKLQALLGNSSGAQEYTIYVCDLDLNVNEDMLREIFEKIYPSVTSSKLIVDPITKTSKGYGFVKFYDYNESQKAIVEMNGKYILNKPIKTNQAVWKKYNPEVSKTGGNQKSYYNKHNNYQNNSHFNNHTAQPSKSNANQNGGYTQNINIYLQSLYQQHYLNNIYLNQYLAGTDVLTQQFSNVSLDNTNNEKVIDNNDDASDTKNEPYMKIQSNIDSTINSEGK